MSNEISWMKKGLKKRRPGEWFSEGKPERSSAQTAPNASSTNDTESKEQTTVPSKPLDADQAVDLTRIPQTILETMFNEVIDQPNAWILSGFIKPELTPSDVWKMYDDETPFQYILTRLPPIFPKGSEELKNDPDGVATCLLYAPTKRVIMDVPGFPERIRRTPKAYHEQLTPQPTAERAKVPVEDVVREETLKLGTLLSIVVEYMDPSSKADFMALENSHEHDGSGPYFGRFRTNSFSLTLPGNVPSNPYAIKCATVGKDISRANHSCCPNAVYSFHKASFSMELRACRNISKGEEITVSYAHNELEPVADRQKALAPYGFTCTCPICIKPDISNPILASLRSLVCEPRKRDHSIKQTQNYIQFMEKWQLESFDIYQDLLLYISARYFATGDRQNGLKFAYKAVRIILARNGRNKAIQCIKQQAAFYDRGGSTILSWLDFI
ncbi:hypothetical protein ABKN59_010195 [Abortiporus biennis]